MDGARTRGQTAALHVIAAMVHGETPPHAILLVGPDGVGKTTLALDLAAGLLCEAAPNGRPCRSCRACRMVANDGHPDLHRLAPAGPGRQVVIGGPEARYRGVRDLIAELALMPVEGRSRVALIEGAERMNEDAQSALLKTLEEPPAGVVIILCADQETRLLPTVRSRCARVRLGLVGSRDIELILADHELADPPLAARLGRLAAGRPGLALAYARAPEAVLIRAELSRILLDLTDAGGAARLAAVRSAIPRAIALVAALGAGEAGSSVPRATRRRGRGAPVTPEPVGSADSETGATDDADGVRGRAVPASERRRAAEILVALWGDVARDLALVGTGGGRSVHDPVLLEELAGIAATVDRNVVTGWLGRADRAVELLASNVSPELLLDSLALAWPRRIVAA
jgi:DNA polymerase III delta' subunit